MPYIKNNIEKIKVVVYCFITAFIILLLTSKCSFLYPLNDWVDANAFFTTGKSMFNGVVPYRDLFEQKGILLYFIYGIGYLISNTSFLGVFILEVLFWTVSLYYVYKIITLFLNKSHAYIIIPIYTSFICISRAFVHGGGAEEFCLPFFSITLYYFLAHFKEKEISFKHLFIAGLCAGSVLLIKYTLLGFWFAFMASIFFCLLIDKKYKKAFISCLVFLSGMFIPIVISCIYLGINHALKDFIKVYFIINMTAYSGEAPSIINRLITIYKGFVECCYKSGIIEFLLIVFMPIMLLKLDINRKGKISLLVVYLFTILGVFWGLKFFRYYMFPMLVFILISLIVIVYLINKVIKINNYKWIISISFVIAILLSWNGANYKEMRFMKKEDLFQTKFAKIINEEKNPTLVNMGYLDCGVYTVADIVPTTYFFEKQNIKYEEYPDNLDSFRKYIEEQTTLFIVYFTKKDLDKLEIDEEMLFNKYDLVSLERQDFEHEMYNAYLFKRKVV